MQTTIQRLQVEFLSRFKVQGRIGRRAILEPGTDREVYVTIMPDGQIDRPMAQGPGCDDSDMHAQVRRERRGYGWKRVIQLRLDGKLESKLVGPGGMWSHSEFYLPADMLAEMAS